MGIKIFLYCFNTIDRILRKNNIIIKNNNDNRPLITRIHINTTGEDHRIINEPLDDDDILKLKENLYKFDLINNLENDNINNIIKLQLLNNNLFDDTNKYSIQLNNSGLYKDWDFNF